MEKEKFKKGQKVWVLYGDNNKITGIRQTTLEEEASEVERDIFLFLTWKTTENTYVSDKGIFVDEDEAKRAAIREALK